MPGEDVARGRHARGPVLGQAERAPHLGARSPTRENPHASRSCDARLQRHDLLAVLFATYLKILVFGLGTLWHRNLYWLINLKP